MPPALLEWIVIVYAIICIFSAPTIFKLYFDERLYMKDMTVGQIIVIAISFPVYFLLVLLTLIFAVTIAVRELIEKAYNKIIRTLDYKPFSRKG